ncbi:MAG: ERF family protein [Lachnospiraceae bacterium]
MTVYEKLLFVQQNLKAPKNQYSVFGDYHYRSCEDIQEALKPLMREVKAVLLVHDDVVMVGDRFYVKATAVFQDAESPDSISNTAFARETESRPKLDAAQITGSCSSYARKYALNGLFCIDDAKDPDSMKNDQQDNKGSNRQQNNRESTKPAAALAGSTQNKGTGSGTVYVTQAHINTLRAEIARTGAHEKSVCERYKIKRLEELNMNQFKSAMLIFQQMQSKQPEPDPYENYQMTIEGMGQYTDEMPFR